MQKRRLWALFMLVAAIGVYAPWHVVFPAAMLDPEYRYALNVAAGQHLAFGREIVFTYGPLAGVYSMQYDRAIDTMSIVFALICASTCALSLVVLGRRAPWPVLLLAPIVLGSANDRDSIFIALPFLAVAAVCEFCRDDETRTNSRAMLVVALCTGLCALLFIKTTFGVLAICAIVAILVLLLSKAAYRLAAATVITVVLVPILFWLFTGQQLADLPHYFVAQTYLLEGYSDAMAADGPKIELLYYGLTAALIVLMSFITWRRAPWFNRIIFTLFLALTVVSTFKTGFVRHDGHALTALSTLLIVGYAVFLSRCGWPTLATMVVVYLAWSSTYERYTGYSFSRPLSPMAKTYREAGKGIWTRVTSRDAYDREYATAVENIKTQYPLPAVSGSADIYPFDQGIVLASGLDWAPRPVLQSYSAYSKRLADIDAAHLLGNRAPDHVFFRIGAIDWRFPALEDGVSWPILATHYRNRGIVMNDYLQLDRVTPTTHAVFSPLIEGEYPIGQQVAVPTGHAMLWVQIDMQPTLAGKLARGLFKLPLLTMIVEFEDGHRSAYRYVATMGQAGFLLSPVLTSSGDFQGFLNQVPFAASGKVRSIGFVGQSGTRWLWSRQFKMKVSEIKFVAN